MNYRQLILQSESFISENPGQDFSSRFFVSGARWMSEQLQAIEGKEPMVFNAGVNYNLYGILKYIVSLSAFFVSLVLFLEVSIFLTPLSIIIFYFFEIHFLFLFPLLIENVKYPVWYCIRQTYKTGLFKTLTIVIPLGFFMVLGLFNMQNPLRNWYIGCLAILILYHYEVRDRV